MHRRCWFLCWLIGLLSRPTSGGSKGGQVIDQFIIVAQYCTLIFDGLPSPSTLALLKETRTKRKAQQRPQLLMMMMSSDFLRQRHGGQGQPSASARDASSRA